MVEDASRLVLDEYTSSFTTYELSPGIHTFNDLSEVFLRNLHQEFLEMITQLILNLMQEKKLIITSDNIVIRFDGNRVLLLSLVLIHLGIINTVMKTLARNV